MRMENISTHAELNAIDMIIHGRVVPKEETIAAIDRVDSEALKRVAHRVFSSKPTLAALGPIKHVMAYEDVLRRLKNA